MDISILITAIASVSSIIGCNIALISWLRSDMNQFESKMDRKVTEIKDQIQQESRDFHGRLCAIEERSKIHSKK